MRRREYRTLTECLRENNIDYRWLIPEGVLFTYRGSRQKINSSMKAKEFLERHASDLGYESTDQKVKQKTKKKKKKEK